MDSLTHIAIGACIGDLFLGKKIGKRAMLYGAIAASLPDIDFVASFWLSGPDDLMAHRGFTHSFLFGLLFILALAFLFRHRHRIEKIPIKTWLLFMGTEIASHLFLDVFNAYGIGWFEPFSHRRFSFNVIFVADPFFSVWPGIAAVSLLVLNSKSNKRTKWATWGLILCFIYLSYCVVNKMQIDRVMRQSLEKQDLLYKRYFTTPTPFNNWLWYNVAETDSGFQIGYHSVFDSDDRNSFHFFPRKDYLLDPFRNDHDLHELIRFSQGYFTADVSEQGVVFNDLRFGQMMGWQDPGASFVFHYYLQNPNENQMVVQRGRFAHWNWKSIRAFVKRIAGKH
jgi:inner membrane protein